MTQIIFLILFSKNIFNNILYSASTLQKFEGLRIGVVFLIPIVSLYYKSLLGKYLLMNRFD